MTLNVIVFLLVMGLRVMADYIEILQSLRLYCKWLCRDPLQEPSLTL